MLNAQTSYTKPANPLPIICAVVVPTANHICTPVFGGSADPVLQMRTQTYKVLKTL
ncbi:MAG: hypothetical protein ACFCUU_01860 [Cyclobacteriaceae bacterium]